MTPSDITTLCQRLYGDPKRPGKRGWRVKAADDLMVHRCTFARWCKGTWPIPGVYVRYLRAKESTHS